MIIDYYAIDPISFRYISHYGVFGMKWGVRRFQNPDGSLKAAGKGRYDGEPMPKSQLGKVSNTKGSNKMHIDARYKIKQALRESKNVKREALERQTIAMEKRGYVFDGEKYIYVGSGTTREGSRLKREAEKKLARMNSTIGGKQKMDKMSKEAYDSRKTSIGSSEYRKTLREIDRRNNSFALKTIGSKKSIYIKDLDDEKRRYY